MLAVIRDLVNDGMTSILVTHEMRFAEEISDNIVFTENGLIVDQGTPGSYLLQVDQSAHQRLRQGSGGQAARLNDGEGI